MRSILWSGAICLLLVACGDVVKAGPAAAPASALPLANAPASAAFDGDVVELESVEA